MRRVLFLPFLLLLFGSCDGDNNGRNVDNSCGLLDPAFVEVPECLTDYFLDNPTLCDCQGEEFVYGFFIASSQQDGNFGSIIGNEFIWEQLSCDSISFEGDVSGVLEGMTVPEPGLLEFVRIFDGEEPDVSECCCQRASLVPPV